MVVTPDRGLVTLHSRVAQTDNSTRGYFGTTHEHRIGTSPYLVYKCMRLCAAHMGLEKAAVSRTEDVALQAKVPMHILVVGARQGGLSTAVALARRGHKVTVLEQAPQLGEVSVFILHRVPSVRDKVYMMIFMST